MYKSKMARFLSMFLVMAMVLSFAPMTAFASDTETGSEIPEAYSETTPDSGDVSPEDSDNVIPEDSNNGTTEGSDIDTTEDSSGSDVPPVEVKYTVNHSVFDTEANDFVLKESEELAGFPGEMTNAQAKDYENYVLAEEILQLEIAADGSTVVELRYVEKAKEPAPVEVKYTVNHSVFDTEANDFVLKESEELAGFPGEMTNAQAKDYENYVLAEEILQLEIAADGSTVVELRYVEKAKEPAPVEVKYTVNHSVLDNSNLDEEVWILKETEELTGIPGELTAAQDKGYEGCILYDEIQQLEIAADGSTVVEVYYIELLEEAVAYVETDLYDTSISNEYFKVISADTYDLAPGAVEHEIVLNNAEGADRKVVHVFEVNTYAEDLEVLPGYWAIDKLDPNNLPLDGVVDKAQYWQAKELTKTVAYYEGMGYNVVGAMNTALAYDSNAPYGYMVWNGKVLGSPEVHSGAQTYLAIDENGYCELRSMSTPLNGTEKTAISANFGWLVRNGELVSKSVERTSSDASRSMIGIKEDGTLIFCQVDGRNGAISSGLSNYEMGEAMLALGCVNAVNCDGGGSSTFVSKRAGESSNTMRSVPSDGAERPTINSVIIATNAGATGIFNKALIETGYNYVAPGASMSVEVTGLDTKGFTMDIPADVSYQIAEEGMGTIENGVYTAGTKLGTATIQALYNGEVVGEKLLEIVHPESFGFADESTILPYGKSLALEVVTAYGDDDWAVCVDGAYKYELDNSNAATLVGDELTATKDESLKGVNVTVTYIPDSTKNDTLAVEFGKGSEMFFDFENGDVSMFLGVDEMVAWANATGAAAPIKDDGNFSENTDSSVFLATSANGQVKNGNYALGVTLDYTNATFASWSYNMFFHTIEDEDVRILRDVANGKNASVFGMWVYIPEGAAGLAMQIQGFKNPDGTGGTGGHFYFTTTTGAVKNLNSCTEADIPPSRWVYATVDLTQFGDFFSLYNPYGTNGREPSFIRFYVKPNVAQNLTFYFDNFALDYSAAVDDRVLPKISNIQYSSSDVAVALENNAVINGDSVAFMATVSDNVKLDTTTAQIYIDGVEVDTQISGQTMSTTESLTLADGDHRVTFEIADTLGNYVQAARVFKVSENEGLVYLAGHNDSGEMPEYDSIYYIDINTKKAENVSYLEANIQLNTGNTWELEHMTAAPGYELEYIQLDAGREAVGYSANSDIHSVENVVCIMLTRTEECTLTGEQTLLSMPARLWSWDGINHVTDEVITPEEQFATGYCPIVPVEADVLFGYYDTADNETVTFGGSIEVETKINDNIYPWHTHDAELTVLSQEATCTAAGYENRTYCETCKSVVDWGEKIEATGHIHAVLGDQLVCACGHVLGGNGLVAENDKIYVMIADKLVTGWQNVDGDWVYADTTTKEVQTGEFTVNGLTYTSDEDGFVVKGAWVTDAKGTKYSYGPEFYKREWVEIDGNTYYFDENCYMYTGVRAIAVNRNNIKEGYKFYEFQEDGVFVREMLDSSGIMTDSATGVKYWVQNGISVYGGLMCIDGDYYYARTSGELVCGKSYWITKNNDLLPVAYYTFDADGKMIDPPVTEEPEPEVPEVKNGIVEEDGKLWWYVDGVKTYAGLMKIDSDYYYARSSGEIITNRAYWITKNNDLLPVASYTFGADGKMVDPPVTEEPDPEPEQPEVPEVPEVKNGIVEEDGKLWWYVNDVKTYAGLMKIDGDYYYARSSGEIVTNRAYWITKNNDLLPVASYTFGADGKMVDPPVTEEPDPEPEQPEVPEVPEVKSGIVEEDGKLWWYVDGVKTYAGLMKIDGDYYYARTSGEILTNREYWITKTNDLLPAAKYSFGADGKMINPPA